MALTVEKDSDHGAALGQLSDVAVHNEAMDGLLQIRFQSGHRTKIAEIIDAVRHMKQQIAARDDVQVSQEFCPLRTDSTNKLNGCLETLIR